MATISLSFVNGGTTVTGSRQVSDANATRILVAERANMGTANNQATVDALIQRFLSDMIGDTKSIERQAVAVADIAVT